MSKSLIIISKEVFGGEKCSAMNAGGLKMLLMAFEERAFIKKLFSHAHANTRNIRWSLLESYLTADMEKEVKGGGWKSGFSKTWFSSVKIQYSKLPSRKL